MSLSDKIWWTRKARIETEKRLLSQALQAQILLYWYSFCSIAAAIYYLKFDTGSDIGPVAWLSLSVLVLSISGFIHGLRFKERAALIKDCYETLGKMVEKLSKGKIEEERAEDEYFQVLSVCENHTERDYFVAICNTNLTTPVAQQSSGEENRQPTKYMWFLFIVYKIRDFLFFSPVYLLPLVLFYVIEIYVAHK